MQRRGAEIETDEESDRTEMLGMKYPAVISPDARSANAVIPKGIAGYRFLVVHANRVLHHSEIQIAH